jgi:secreted trypsin-like serine protease
MVNDTGLLLLEEEIDGASTTRLPSSAEIKKFQANKGVKYEIAGWGKDQNDELASYLRKAAVTDQTSVMKKFKWWKNDVWFAVGKYNSKEKVYAGSCNGDSGGPLFATVGNKTILAGITSWGAEDCETKAPSIYVRLSYYIDTIIKVGIPALYTNEVKQNRALPSVIDEPTISGVALPDSLLTCNSGTWCHTKVRIPVRLLERIQTGLRYEKFLLLKPPRPSYSERQ